MLNGKKHYISALINYMDSVERFSYKKRQSNKIPANIREVTVGLWVVKCHKDDNLNL